MKFKPGGENTAFKQGLAGFFVIFPVRMMFCVLLKIKRGQGDILCD